MKVRTERIALQMQKEISEIIQTQVKDPRVGFVTVTAVEVSSDHTHAKVFVSILGNEEERVRSMQALERAKGFIRTEVGRRIRLRVTPELHLKRDESMDYSSRIGKVLQEIAAREEPNVLDSAKENEEDV
ncbi:MAG: 30S ribosome-binding factor RbfA [Firmicutes bacterium]|nr:30S ribosome-binding factor RbfA [Bacillota bacterium]